MLTSVFCLLMGVIWHLVNLPALSVPGGEGTGSSTCSTRGMSALPMLAAGGDPMAVGEPVLTAEADLALSLL